MDKHLIEKGLTRATAMADQYEIAKAASREEYLACAFLLGSDSSKRYGELIEDFENAIIFRRMTCTPRH